jgi:SOS-response transcriptional repressor LexA
MLGQNQEKVLNFVAASIRTEWIAPTFREIAGATGLSTSAVRWALMDLENLGYIERRYHKFRAIKVLRWPEEVKAA